MAREDGGGNGGLLFLVGAVAGAVLGVMFAPRSGEETREQINDWLKERRERGTELLSRVRDESQAKKEAILTAARAAREAYGGGKQENSGA